ncbi:MAG: hypothetical protein KF773_26865 [Deltaproteobacteria bacterium]|nr:hypothetical protein [Deltaproteobacteria bacterium]MCW5803493.1 hypothetical protein [Deltaproteobacteria bacterium]
MRTLLTLTAILGLVGCIGGIDQPPGDDDQPPVQDPTQPPPPSVEGKKLFDQGVYPAISAKCGACHSQPVSGGAPANTDFVGTAANGYQLMLTHNNVHGNFLQNARILVKVAEGHYGPWGTDQQAAIEAWFQKELQERSGGGSDPLPVQPAEKLLQNFASCMTLETFSAANMAQACGNQNCENNQQCRDCHIQASPTNRNFLATDRTQDFFARLSTNRVLLQKYFLPTPADSPNPTMSTNMQLFEMALGAQGAYFQHPRVNNGNGTPTNNGCTQAMTAFLNATVQKMVAAGPNGCGPSPLE